MKNILRNKFVIISSIIILITGIFVSVKLTIGSLSETHKVMNHLPTVTDLNEENFISGVFADNADIVENKNYISVDSFLEMKRNAFMVTLPNEFIRIEIREYDAEFNYIGLTDIAHLDYFQKNTNTKYLLFSFYKMNTSGDLDESTYEELFNIFKEGTIEYEFFDDINTEEVSSRQSAITTYLSDKTFLNIASYKRGTHASGWGAGTGYTYNENSVSSRNYYKVIPGTKYYISSNDSRYIIHIQWRNDKGSWSKSAFDWKGGKGFVTVTVPDNAYAISITLTSQDNKIGSYYLVNTYGVRVSLDKDEYYFSTTPKAERDIVLTDVNEWKTGNYGYEGGEYYNVFDTYASKYYYKNSYGNKRMQYKTNDENYNINVVQIDKTGKNIGNVNLTSDKLFTFKTECAYYAVVVNNRVAVGNESRVDFLDALNNGLVIELKPYVKYKHNTNMNDITNNELLSKLTTGWNLGNTFDSHNSKFVESTAYWDPETYWGQPYVTENLIKYVKSRGFNNIRIPITFINNYYIDENGNYRFREEHLERVQQVVDLCLKYDMYVVINTHFDSGMSASPIKVGAENKDWERATKYAKQLWTQIAEYFKDYDEHLMFESYNEVDNPYVSRRCTDLAAAQMNELNQIFVDTVRSTGGNNEKRILQLQTFLSSRSANALNSFKVPDDIYPNKLIAHVHSYPATWDEKVEQDFIDLNNFTERTGLPVVIGEFGYKTNFSPSTFRYVGISNYIARAKNHNIVVYIWDNGSDFAAIYRKSLTADEKYIDAIFNAKPYTTGDKTVINKYEDWICGKLNQSKGTVEEKYDGWGTILTHKIPVEQGSNFLQVDLTSKGEAEPRKLHYVFFYDENDKFISDYAINIGYPGFNSKFIIVPPEAKTVMFGINSSEYKTRVDDYKRYFANGDLYLEYKFLNVEIDRTLKDTPLTGNQVMLDDFRDFEWGMLYPGSGEVKINIGWGEVTTNYIDVSKGSKFEFKFLRRASATISPRHVVFYDENKKYIPEGSVNNSSQNGILSASYDIPKNAKYVRVGLTGLSNFKKNEYNMMFATGDAVFIYEVK